MNEPVYFLSLSLENVRCFGEKAILDLSDGRGNWKRWTVVLGDNGTGKTTLLQIISGLEQIEETSYDKERRNVRELVCKMSVKGFYNQKYLTTNVASAVIKATLNRNPNKSGLSNNPNLPHIQFSQQHNGWGTSVRQLNTIEELKCFGYGANRFMSSNSITESKSENSETLFNDDAKLINAEEWLLQLDYAASKDSNIKAFAQNKRNQVEQILIDLLPDVNSIRFTTPTKENLKSTIEFETPFGWVSIHQLSLGYKTMVAWMVDLAARLFERYPDSNNSLAEPAIVLVDEIDLHLHPKWQRKIFDYLSEKFPQTQFIVTAHSPLIVQSAPADANIVVLRKEGNHVIIDNDVKSVRNWRLDQIMSSDLFNIESVRGPETEKWLKERSELLKKQSLTTAEKARLETLNRLAHNLPTADNEEDIEAMRIIREAAEYLKAQKA